jgi:hypothetical protein
MTPHARTSRSVTHHLSRVTRPAPELSPLLCDTTRGASSQVVTHVTGESDSAANTLVTHVTGLSGSEPIRAHARPCASVIDMPAPVTCHGDTR